MNHCFDDELHGDIAALGTQGAADADFPRALGHRNQHDIHDADPPHDQRNGGDYGDEVLHRRRQNHGELGHLLNGTDVEIVGGAGFDVMAFPQHLDYFVFRSLYQLG